MKNWSLPQMQAMFAQVAVLIAVGLAPLLTGCASQKLALTTQQNVPTTQVLVIHLHSEDLRAGGLAIITPSSATGQ